MAGNSPWTVVRGLVLFCGLVFLAVLAFFIFTAYSEKQIYDKAGVKPAAEQR